MGVMNWVSVSRCWSDDGRHLVVPVTHLNSAKITFVRSEPGLGWKRIRCRERICEPQGASRGFFISPEPAASALPLTEPQFRPHEV